MRYDEYGQQDSVNAWGDVMDKALAAKQIAELRNGVIAELLVKKEDFLTFRAVLIEQPDFKHFRGIAQRGGHVLYHYMDTPRS
ncbi:Conserved hypothetical protein [Geobacillus thermodenitrificans NG80-2]|uniref:Uncharacterized protein n=2 Tax=Geobacillus thermodenitrificans TaxID=33940 RepID=A4ILP4_GEOTN|nr:Conserved hypothetical protein [Geobacillus thermodenitrificans NG80-2]